MKHVVLDAVSWSTYKNLYLALGTCIVAAAAVMITTPQASALECDDIAWSDNYCSFSSTTKSGSVIPASGVQKESNWERRLVLIEMLKARKSGNTSMGTWSVGVSYTEPVVLLVDEIDMLEMNYDVDAGTLNFLKAMEDMMEDKTHKEQLNIILNVTNSLYQESAASLKLKGIDKQQVAEVLYYVVLRYLVNTMSGIDIMTSEYSAADEATDLFGNELEDEDTEDEEEIILDDEDEELVDIIEEIFAD